MKRPGALVGIDLGTTYSLVAAFQDGRPVVLPNVLGELLTPSAVSVEEDGTVLVGAAARARAATHPEATALAFKRDMGTDRVYTLGSRSFRPEELSALVLAELKRDAEEALGEPVTEAVVTVPAYFGEPQRRATHDACKIAGLHVERIVNEPTAAALAYGLGHGGEPIRAVVLDLGGGTFDVTVLQIEEGVIEILGSAGDARLGGEDFTECLAEEVARRIHRAHGLAIEPGSVAWARVREATEQAKRRMTPGGTVNIALPALGPAPANDVLVSLRSTDAEAVWQPLLRRLHGPIARALGDSRLEASAIDAVLLVGGATRMPCVVDLAAERFGRVPDRHLPPDEAVALGAAVQAALKADHAAVADLVSTDIAPFSLGIDTAARHLSQIVSGIYTPILERGTVLPASRVETFATMSDQQREIHFGVYQGEHALARDNVKLGEVRIGVPRRRAGEAEIEVRFTYDLNGLLEVEAHVPETGEKKTLLLDRSGGRLPPKDLERAKADLARLKVHPRDHLPNVTALRRADALHAELLGDDRELLRAAMVGLRLALERQDRKEIEHARGQLVQILSALRAPR